MAYWKTLRGARGWFGKSEAKAAGKRSRRQEDRERIEEGLRHRHHIACGQPCRHR